MQFALIPNISMSSAGLPLLGTSLTANFLMLISRSSLRAPATASPSPPGKNQMYIFATLNEICIYTDL